MAALRAVGQKFNHKGLKGLSPRKHKGSVCHEGKKTQRISLHSVKRKLAAWRLCEQLAKIFNAEDAEFFLSLTAL
jgi:hypothetical protein